jgi:hypothetical protein
VSSSVESHAGAVAHLIHTANSIVLDDKFRGHIITWREFHDETTAYAATGTCRNVVNFVSHSSSVRTARASYDDVRKDGRIWGVFGARKGAGLQSGLFALAIISED